MMVKPQFRETDLAAMDAKIRLMRQTAEELLRLSAAIPALSKNTARILVGIKMLELNLPDLTEIRPMGSGTRGRDNS